MSIGYQSSSKVIPDNIEMSEIGGAQVRAEDAYGSVRMEGGREEDMAARHNNNVVVGAKVVDCEENVVSQGNENLLGFCLILNIVVLQIKFVLVIEPEKEKGARAASGKAVDALDDEEDGNGRGGRQGE